MIRAELDQEFSNVGSEFPEKMRAFRKAARLSQAEVADRAGISRRTLIRWESGEASPLIPELQAVFNVLNVQREDRATVIGLLDTLRARKVNPNQKTQPDWLKLSRHLHVLRNRAGWSAAQLASGLKVHSITLLRWERGDLLIRKEKFDEALLILKIGEEELRLFYELLHQQPTDRLAIEDARTMLAHLEGVDDPHYAVLADLRYAILIDQLADTAQSEAGYQSLLAQAHAGYALFLSKAHRWREALTECSEVLRLERSLGSLGKSTVYRANLIAALCRFQSSWRSAQRGLSILDSLEFSAMSFADLSWRQSLYGKCYARHGNERKAIERAQAAVASARRADSTCLYQRQVDLAETYLLIGKAQEALDHLPELDQSTPSISVEHYLLLSNILKDLGRNKESEHWSQVASSIAYRYHLQVLFRGRIAGPMIGDSEGVDT